MARKVICRKCGSKLFTYVKIKGVEVVICKKCKNVVYENTNKEE